MTVAQAGRAGAWLDRMEPAKTIWKGARAKEKMQNSTSAGTGGLRRRVQKQRTQHESITPLCGTSNLCGRARSGGIVALHTTMNMRARNDAKRTVVFGAGV
jgi:hypothetical protein